MRRSSRLPLEQLTPCLLPLDDPPRLLDWPTVFGNDHPVEVEVGSGKGLFLLNASQSRPEVNFVGIEIERKYQLLAATRLVKHGRDNVKVACGDGLLFLAARVLPGSLGAIHVYFPDPWWKNRHRKRRLFTAAFVEACAAALAAGGRLHFVTDVAEYAAQAAVLLDACPSLALLPPPAPTEPSHDLDYLTNFERKFRKEGRPIRRLLYQLRPSIDGAPSGC